MPYVSRDPFAREETHRRRVYGKATCAWCGCNKQTPSGKAFLFQYWVETDGGRKYEDRELFCSADCRRIYGH